MAGATTAVPAQIDLWCATCTSATCPPTSATGRAAPEYYGNSIFLFESAGLCVAHLSHLHHLLTEQDLATLGHIDVVMAPVDGAYTMSHADMAKVLDELQPRLVLPMHYFTREVLDQFLALEHDRYAVRRVSAADNHDLARRPAGEAGNLDPPRRLLNP